MSFYNVVNSASMQSGQPEDIGPVLANFNAIAAVLNGGVDNSNIAAGAGIDVSKLNIPPTIGTVPIGGMIDYAGSGDPLGGYFLLADGRLLSRTAYPALFTAIGTTYGAGDGSTTFGIPDLRGRASIGPDNMGTGAGAANRVSTNNARGNVGGAETVTLTTTQMPSHAHGGSTNNDTPDHSHSGSGTGSTNTTGGHSHRPASADQWAMADGTNNVPAGGGSINRNIITSRTSVTTTDGDHAHTVSVSVSVGGASTRHTHPINAEGGGAAHPNLQPYQIVNKLIRVL